jgi:type I restriction enzyme M protein
MERDKVNLDITWLAEETQAQAEELPDPDVLAAQIAEDLEAAAAEFAEIVAAVDPAQE